MALGLFWLGLGAIRPREVSGHDDEASVPCALVSALLRGGGGFRLRERWRFGGLVGQGAGQPPSGVLEIESGYGRGVGVCEWGGGGSRGRKVPKPIRTAMRSR